MSLPLAYFMQKSLQIRSLSILLLYNCCLRADLFSQSSNIPPEDIYFEKLTAENGLSNNVVKCILLDKEGFLWIGTADGLNRYDGRNFKVFRNDLSNPNSISGNIITGIAEDKKGILWISTQDGGLCCYNRNRISSLQFEQYRHDSKNPASIPANNLNGLTIDKDDNIWVATEGNGVFEL